MTASSSSAAAPAQQDRHATGRSVTQPWSDLSAEVDTEALRLALLQALPAEQSIDALRVLKLRRSSSHRRDPHPIRLWLEARWHDRRRARRGAQLLYAKAYRDGASAAAFELARRRDAAAPAFGEALCHVPALDLLLWAWPNDPVLDQLPLLVRHEHVQQLLPAAAGEGVQGHELLRYEPEQRATLRWTLATAGGRSRTVYGKTFADDELARRLHRRFDHFHRLARHDADAPDVPEPLGVDARTRTLWQAAAAGTPLGHRLGDPEAERHLAAVGRALARLHATPAQAGTPAALAGDDVRQLAHWREEIARRQRKIARGLPALAARSEALLRRLDDAAGALPPEALTLIHGDFHADQVWIDGQRPVLFDFDEFCLGHPMEDLASFGVKLQQVQPGDRGVRLVRAFEQGYREAARTHWCPSALAWHRAVQALLQASRAFVFQVPGWPQELQSRLTRAEALTLETAR